MFAIVLGRFGRHSVFPRGARVPSPSLAPSRPDPAGALTSLIGHAVSALGRYERYRHASAELRDLTPGDLDDLGLTAADVPELLVSEARRSLLRR